MGICGSFSTLQCAKPDQKKSKSFRRATNAGYYQRQHSQPVEQFKNAGWGHPAYRISVENVASVGPVPSPGNYFDRLLAEINDDSATNLF
jgi:hypothetical protein